MTDQPKASDLVAEAKRWADDCDRSFYSSPFEKDAATLVRRLADEVEFVTARAQDTAKACQEELDRFYAREARLQGHVVRLIEALQQIRSYEQMRAGRSAYSHLWDIANQALSEETPTSPAGKNIENVDGETP